MTTIKSPDTTYSGRGTYGPDVVLDFEDGVAEFDGDLPVGVRQYLKGAGYGIDEAAQDPPTTPVPPDPRDVTNETVGTPLRDAAVDPEPTDFLAPTNAGQANPHGPDVVSPELHASEGVRPVKPGPVGDNETQDALEVAHAAAATDGTPVENVTAVAPAGNASEETWRAYALSLPGVSEADVSGLGRNALRDTYGPAKTEGDEPPAEDEPTA